MSAVNTTKTAFTQAFSSVADAFKASGNYALSFYYNDLLVSQIAALIAKRGVTETQVNTIRSILERFDFRVVADYLSLSPNDENKKQLFEKMLRGDAAAIYEYQSAKFLNNQTSAGQNSAPPRTVAQLEDIFADEGQNQRLVYYYDQAAAASSGRLFADIGNRPGAFFDFQPDLPGVNSLVREGLVKSFVQPDGTTVITKRNNPNKKGRFLTEQQNIQTLIVKLGLPEENSVVTIGADNAGKEVQIKLIRPFAVLTDPETSAFYSLSNYAPHPTLEQVLLQAKDTGERKTHLANCRKLLDHLYEKGIVWGDMAPRNILVEQAEAATIYHVLDFEKTDIRPASVPLNDRVEHCRGPMCVEEFGAVCDPSEVKACFAGYFDPDNWNTTNNAPVPLHKPKREVVDILNGRGKSQFSFGDYNQTEQEIIGIRFPYLDSKGARRFPLHVSFKIDHYYGAEYDRRTTEVLMAAKRFGCLEDVQNWLEMALDDQDNQKLLSVFKDGNANSSENMAKLIQQTLDALFDAREDQRQFTRLADKMGVDFGFDTIRRAAALDPFSGRALAANNTALVGSRLASLQKELTQKFGDVGYLVYASGSFARGEFTHDSDLDIGVVANDARLGREIEQFISSYAVEQLHVPVGLYPSLSMDGLASFMEANPDYCVDFAWAKIINGDKKMAADFAAVTEAKLSHPAYMERAQAFFETLPDGMETTSPQALLKQLSFARALATQQGLSDEATKKLNHQLDIVLFLKNEGENYKHGYTSGYVPTNEFMTAALLGNSPFFPDSPRPHASGVPYGRNERS